MTLEKPARARRKFRGRWLAPIAGLLLLVLLFVLWWQRGRLTAYADTAIDHLLVRDVALSPVSEWQGGAGGNLPTLDINNWAPPDLQTNSFIVTRGADNEGSRITGIDATGITDGAVRFFVNLPTGASPPTDSGTLTFVHESSSSTAANRIQTPGAVDCTFPIYSVVGIVYGGLDGTDPTPVKRWRLLGSCGWTAQAKTQRLQFYPICGHGTGGAPITGTINNYRPTCNTQFAAGYWLAGALTDSYDYTVIQILTGGAGVTLTGLYTGGNVADPKALGPVKIIKNIGSGTVTIKYLDAGSDVNNRFVLPRARDLVLQPFESALFISPLNNSIDLVAQWHLVSVGQSNEFFPSVNTTGTTALDGPIEFGSIATPSALASGTTQNYDPGSRSFIYRLTAHASNSTLGGLVAPALGADEFHVIQNIGSGTLSFTNLDGGSTAGNRFATPGGFTLSLPANGSAFIRYDPTTTAWYFVAHSRMSNAATFSSSVATNAAMFTDANGTLAPMSPVSDNGATLSLGAGRLVSIAGATTFTQAFSGGIGSIQAPAWADRLVPAALTSSANNNDWNPTDFNTREHVVVQTSTGSLATLTGMNALGANGTLKTLCNFGSGPVKLTNNDANSTAAYRFTLADGVDATLPTIVTGKIYCISFRYDASDQRWEETWTNFYGRNPAAPTASTCGTGPTFSTNSTNEAFSVTTGTGATACTITFGNSGYTNDPTCTVSAQDGTPQAYTHNATSLTLTAANASAIYDVICRGK